jgi:hypothetical protein
MKTIRFSVFGRIVLVEKTGNSWRSFYAGTDGKMRAADFVIPDFIEDGDLEQYLGDLFHENATPAHSDVIRL